MSERVFLGLGANLGNREANLRAALRWLAPAVRVAAVSALYRAEAVVPAGPAAGPEFLNAACEVETALSPGELLSHIKRIEWALGRRPAPRWAPRPIDIDVLLYGARIIEVEGLTVPHPLLHERAFVLLPLVELAPEAAHPRLGRTIAQLAATVDGGGVERIAGPSWVAGTAEV